MVPASVPASLSPAYPHAYSANEVDSDANPANPVDSDSDAVKTDADSAELDAAPNLHRESSWGSADTDANLHRDSGRGYADADSESAAGGPRHGDSPEKGTRQVNAESPYWNDDAG